MASNRTGPRRRDTANLATGRRPEGRGWRLARKALPGGTALSALPAAPSTSCAFQRLQVQPGVFLPLPPSLGLPHHTSHTAHAHVPPFLRISADCSSVSARTGNFPPHLRKLSGPCLGAPSPQVPPSVCAGAHSVAVGSHPQNPQHALTHTLTNHAGPPKDSAVTRKIHAARVSPLPPFLPPSLTSIPYFKVRHPHSRGHGRLCLIRPCRMYESSTPIPHPSTNSRARHRLRSWPS